MSKKQFYKEKASAKIKAFILIPAVYALVFSVFVAVILFLLTVLVSSKEMLGNAILFSSLKIALIAIGVNFVMSLWLMIGKSSAAAIILFIYQIAVIVMRFIYDRFTPASIFFSFAALAVYFLGVLGTLELDKKFKAYSAEGANRQ